MINCSWVLYYIHDVDCQVVDIKFVLYNKKKLFDHLNNSLIFTEKMMCCFDLDEV